jgi:hypothetical protein
MLVGEMLTSLIYHRMYTVTRSRIVLASNRLVSLHSRPVRPPSILLTTFHRRVHNMEGPIGAGGMYTHAPSKDMKHDHRS